MSVMLTWNLTADNPNNLHCKVYFMDLQPHTVEENDEEELLHGEVANTYIDVILAAPCTAVHEMFVVLKLVWAAADLLILSICIDYIMMDVPQSL